jgi:hypothetical protein
MNNLNRSGTRVCRLISGLALAVSLMPIAAQSATSSPAPDQLLLKDYRPKSLFKIPQTRVEKARFPVFDMHSHDYVKTAADVDQWVRTMDAVGLAKTVILAGSTGPQCIYHWPLYGFGLSEDILKKIYFDNARKLHLKVKRP